MGKPKGNKRFDGLHSIGEWLKYFKMKKQLKAAFRRKPRPAKVRIPDEE